MPKYKKRKHVKKRLNDRNNVGLPTTVVSVKSKQSEEQQTVAVTWSWFWYVMVLYLDPQDSQTAQHLHMLSMWVLAVCVWVCCCLSLLSFTASWKKQLWYHAIKHPCRTSNFTHNQVNYWYASREKGFCTAEMSPCFPHKYFIFMQTQCSTFPPGSVRHVWRTVLLSWTLPYFASDYLCVLLLQGCVWTERCGFNRMLRGSWNHVGSLSASSENSSRVNTSKSKKNKIK